MRSWLPVARCSQTRTSLFIHISLINVRATYLISVRSYRANDTRLQICTASASWIEKHSVWQEGSLLESSIDNCVFGQFAFSQFATPWETLRLLCCTNRSLRKVNYVNSSVNATRASGDSLYFSTGLSNKLKTVCNVSMILHGTNRGHFVTEARLHYPRWYRGIHIRIMFHILDQILNI